MSPRGRVDGRTAIRRPTGWRADALFSLGLALVVLGPALAPGYVLRGDMVFVPDQPWKPEWLGMGQGYPRSAPMDAVVWFLTLALPGWVVQKALLLGSLVLAGVGAGRLVASFPGYARAAAVVLAVWNPYVAERLLIGQWPLVLGWALLPWAALAAWAYADPDRGGRGNRGSRLDRAAPVVLVLALSAVVSPPSGLMSLLVVVGVLLGLGTRRHAVGALGWGALVNLVWVAPALLAARTGVPAPGQFESFVARGESAAGTFVALLSFGGIWKESVWPPERTSVVLTLVAAGVTGVALWGWRWVGPGRERRLLPGLAAVAAVSLLLALLPSLPGAAGLLDALAARVPAVGLLRDSQRFVAPAYLVLLPGLAATVRQVVRAARPGRESLRLVAAGLVATPVLVLPGLAWGVSGQLRPVDYPAEWRTVADLVAAEPPAGLVVLPWAGFYRGFAWNPSSVVLDPAPRYFPGEVIVDDRLVLPDRVLPAESPRVAEVTAALEVDDPAGSAAALRALGVRWVLVEKGPPLPAPPEGVVVHDGPGLQLIDTGFVSDQDLGPTVSWPILLIDAGILLLMLMSVARISVRFVYSGRTVPGEGYQ